MARTASPTRLPTPAALSSTILDGTPPTCSITRLNPSHTHSAFSAGNSRARPALEYGNMTTKKPRRVRVPRR